MSAARLRYQSYDWRGTAEWMLRVGPDDGFQAIIFQPLFEEMNFARMLVLDLARLLAGTGIASWIPDLPGTGESLRPLGQIGWGDWREAAQLAAATIEQETGRQPHILSLRGGTLLADAAAGRSWWSFAPASGAALLRQLERTKLLSDVNSGGHASGNTQEYVGYELSSDLHSGLAAATIVTPAIPHRTAPPELAESRVPLWNRAEPARDPALAAALAADIVQWIDACERR